MTFDANLLNALIVRIADCLFEISGQGHLLCEIRGSH